MNHTYKSVSVSGWVAALIAGCGGAGTDDLSGRSDHGTDATEFVVDAQTSVDAATCEPDIVPVNLGQTILGSPISSDAFIQSLEFEVRVMRELYLSEPAQNKLRELEDALSANGSALMVRSFGAAAALDGNLKDLEIHLGAYTPGSGTAPHGILQVKRRARNGEPTTEVSYDPQF